MEIIGHKTFYEVIKIVCLIIAMRVKNNLITDINKNILGLEDIMFTPDFNFYFRKFTQPKLNLNST